MFAIGGGGNNTLKSVKAFLSVCQNSTSKRKWYINIQVLIGDSSIKNMFGRWQMHLNSAFSLYRTVAACGREAQVTGLSHRPDTSMCTAQMYVHCSQVCALLTCMCTALRELQPTFAHESTPLDNFCLSVYQMLSIPCFPQWCTIHKFYYCHATVCIEIQAYVAASC